LTILVVDDEPLLRWSIAALLRRGGDAVIEAASAADARDAMNRTTERIDVVLLDSRLSDSNDLRLLQEVRHRLPQSAVALMTACGTPEMVGKALDLGACCILTKPFDMREVEILVARARRYLETRPLLSPGLPLAGHREVAPRHAQSAPMRPHAGHSEAGPSSCRREPPPSETVG
jgi:two-component system response regulator PilR (NtrC family)